MKIKTAALIIGIVFLAVGLLGFVPNPLFGISEGVLFHADTVHSIVHIVSGLLFILVATSFPDATRAFMMIFGVVYFLIGVLGLMNIGSDGMTTVLGFLHVNGPDNYLHIALGVIIFLAALLKPKPKIVA